MIINGVELQDIDTLDAIAMERYEAAHDTVYKKLTEYSAEGKRTSEVIRFQCETIFEFFETVFGDGTAKKVFGESVNMAIVGKAYGSVVDAVNKHAQNTAAEYKSQYSNLHNKKQHKQKKKKHYNNRSKSVRK